MSVKLEREAQEREEAMQQIREQEAKLNEANARVSEHNCFIVNLYLPTAKVFLLNHLQKCQTLIITADILGEAKQICTAVKFADHGIKLCSLSKTPTSFLRQKNPVHWNISYLRYTGLQL